MHSTQCMNRLTHRCTGENESNKPRYIHLNHPYGHIDEIDAQICIKGLCWRPHGKQFNIIRWSQAHRRLKKKMELRPNYWIN